MQVLGYAETGMIDASTTFMHDGFDFDGCFCMGCLLLIMEEWDGMGFACTPSQSSCGDKLQVSASKRAVWS